MKKYKIFCLAIMALLAISCLCSCEKGSSGPAASPTPTPLMEKPTATPFITPTPIMYETGTVEFSISESFLSTTEHLTLTASDGAVIYYTTDGSEPDETSVKYSSPITLMAGKSVKANVIRAKAKFQDGTWSETVTRTYFTGRSIDSRYDCLVVEVTTDPDNLWDYETGIFTGGKILDDYLSEHPGTSVDGSVPANYNQLRGMEGEREAYVEMFTEDGSLIIAQNSGLRCYGGWSRADEMKPMKLFARKEYSESNSKFKYPFFTSALDENGDVIDSFKRLVLRSCGNDLGFAFIREELFETLAKQAGYLGKSVRPCAVYVNGEYYGFYWLTEVYHESYFEAHYGKFAGTMEILEGGELYKSVDDDGANEYAVNDYEEIYNGFAYIDLRDEDAFNALCEYIDVQNYLEFYAYQIFLGNNDWPNNNYKVYRYYAAEGEEYSEAPFDGKWRYLLHDMDYSTGIYGESTSSRNLTYYLGTYEGVKNDICPLFGRLMQREDCREIFARKMLDLINGVFAPDYFNEQLDILNESRMNELSYSYDSGKIDSWVQPDQLEGRLESLKSWVEQRGTYMYTHVYRFLKIQETTYTLNVETPEKSEVTINSWTVSENFTGKYYAGIDTVLTAEDKYGRPAISWIVNGETVEGESLTIDADVVNGGRTVEVTPVFE